MKHDSHQDEVNVQVNFFGTAVEGLLKDGTVTKIIIGIMMYNGGIIEFAAY
ncbi:hypothetical protein [Filimonas effusa]|uniref:hypothetical protein n=1 Tax=Filimonas effusa TaxID=2508721 RepID=UPI0013E972C2|nr:hypothetical protein [Filimonas effusa]